MAASPKCARVATPATTPRAPPESLDYWSRPVAPGHHHVPVDLRMKRVSTWPASPVNSIRLRPFATGRYGNHSIQAQPVIFCTSSSDAPNRCPNCSVRATDDIEERRSCCATKSLSRSAASSASREHPAASLHRQVGRCRAASNVRACHGMPVAGERDSAASADRLRNTGSRPILRARGRNCR